jgi:hypothetical protein
MSQAKTRKAAPVYSEEKRQAAAAARNYIKIGDTRGNLLLSGAVQKWKSDPTFVYVPSLRVAGQPDQIVQVLAGLGLSEADVRAHVNAGYRAGSETRADFVAELADLKANKPKAVKKVTTALPNSIAWYAAQVDEATVVTKEGGSPRKARKSRSTSPKRKAAKKGAAKKGAKKTAAKPRKSRSKSASPKKNASPKKKSSPKAKRAAKPLGDKIANLSEGKYMDVSNLHVDGSGAKTVGAPGPKSKKVLIPGTRIVSDGKRGVNAAAKLLEDESLPERWVAAQKGGARASSPAATVAMSPAASSPRASLPPLPSSKSGGVRLPTVPVIGSPRSPKV